MRVDPNFEPQGVTGLPSAMSTYASIAADGSVGFSTSFNVSSLWVNPTDVSSFFNGNLAEYQVRGFNSSFFVEVVAVPAPGAVALFGLAGLAGRRRRR
jgi:MYXO-CTERM domain-containing protein